MGNAASTHAHQQQQSNHTNDIHARLAQHLQHAHAPTLNLTVGTSPNALNNTTPSKHHHHHTTPSVRKPCACAHLHPGKTCLSFLVSSFGRSFYLAYGIKAGITLALHIIKLLRSKTPLKVFDLNELVSAHGLPIDAVRMGLFMGGFTGLYNGIRCLLARWLGQDNPKTVMFAGAVAGLSIIFQPKDTHRTLALYAWARVLQCWYNKSKLEGKWHLWGSDWAHGDSLLFSVCSAQVMYAYVLRPETLPPAYWKFIVDTGPIPIPVLENVKANTRGLPIDMNALTEVYNKLAPAGSKPIEGILTKLAQDYYGSPTANPLLPPIIPCSMLHPHNPSCSHQWVETFLNGAKRSLPIYLSLTFVPMFVLRFWLLIKHPLDQIQKGLWSVTKSTAFLSSFVTVYMWIVCMHRRVFTKDHRFLYWFAGFIASWTILLEQKSRRSELALYVLPRTIDSLIQTMQSRQMLADIPHGEKGLFMLGMGALMYYREYHCDSMSPLLKRVLNFFVPSYKSLPHDHTSGKLVAGELQRGVSTNAVEPTLAAVGGAGPDALVDASPTAAASTAMVAEVDPMTPSCSGSDASSGMRRVDSDGLSTESVNGVIPLPQPGISLSREQSFACTSNSGSSNGHSHHYTTTTLEPFSPASSPCIMRLTPPPIAAPGVGVSLQHAPASTLATILSSDMPVTPGTPTTASQARYQDSAPPVLQQPQQHESTTRPSRHSFVEEKVEAIEQHIQQEHQHDPVPVQQQQQQQQQSQNGKRKKGGR